MHIFLYQQTDFFIMIFNGYVNATRPRNKVVGTESDEEGRERFQSYSQTGLGADQIDMKERS